MKVVVTGGSGSIGTALLRLLARNQRYSVTAIARRAPDTRQHPYRHAEWVETDIGAPGATERLAGAFRGADVVVHLAWAIQPASTESAMYRTNVAGSRAVLDAVRSADVPHLIAASSVAAYRPAPRLSRVNEDWPCEGLSSAYGQHKAALESLLDVAEVTDPRRHITRLRPCGVLQRDSGRQVARWVLSPLVPAGVIGSRWLPVPLWPALRLQLVHADDVAEAIHLAMAHRATGAFNLAAEPVLTAKDLARALGRFLVPVPRPVLSALALGSWRTGLQPLHPAWLTVADQAPLIDTTRARRELGWEPHHESGAVLAELVDGMRATDVPPSAVLRERTLSRFRPGRPISQSQSPHAGTATGRESR